MPTVAGVACIVGAAALALFELDTYTTWGTTQPSVGPPARIQWCGRRYLPGQHALTPAEVSAQLALGAPGQRLVQVATAPSGYPVMAAPMSAGERAAYHTDVCAMVVYVRLAPASYLPYGLSGGP